MNFDIKSNFHPIEPLPPGIAIENDPGKIATKIEIDQATIATVGTLRERPDAFFITIAESQRKQVCNQWWSCIKGKMELIGDMNVPYKLWGPNSNSAAFSVLRACEFPTSKAAYSGFPWWRFHDGWDIDLFASSYSPFQPTPTSVPEPLIFSGTPIP